MMTILQEFSINEQIAWRNGATSTTSTSYVDFSPGSGMNVTFTKVLDSSVIVVELYTSCYHTNTGDVDWAVRINGVDYDMIRGYQDSAGNHRGYGATREITGIAAGEYTIQARWKRTSTGDGGGGSATTDANDTQSLVVREKKVPL